MYLKISANRSTKVVLFYREAYYRIGKGLFWGGYISRVKSLRKKSPTPPPKKKGIFFLKLKINWRVAPPPFFPADCQNSERFLQLQIWYWAPKLFHSFLKLYTYTLICATKKCKLNYTKYIFCLISKEFLCKKIGKKVICVNIF